MGDTVYELVVVIAAQGHSDALIDAAREKGAGGGTIIHARGEGADNAKQLLGFTVAEEKEVIYIATKRESKNDIMKAIMDQADAMKTERPKIFSLPVTNMVGLHLGEVNESEQ